MPRKTAFLFVLAALSLLPACASQPEAPDPLPESISPPELTVTAGEEHCTALRGGWSWTVLESEDQYSSTIADSSHPLALQRDDPRPPMTVDAAQAVLSFALAPDSVTARCWPEPVWEDDDPPGEEAAVEDGILTLKPGVYLYEIQAEWDHAPEYWGDASYSFLAAYSPD